MKESSNLKHKTISGVVWSGIGQFGGQAIHFVVLLVLARFLTPTDFGLAGIAMLFILFAQTISQFGMGSAVVQQAKLEEPMLSTAFWINFILSSLLMGVTIWAAPAITTFLGDAAATPLLRALSVIFLLEAFAMVPTAVLEKKLDFQQVMIRQIGSEIGYGVVGVTMAFMGYGVWSLAGAALTKSALKTILLWGLVPWRPRFIFNRDAFRSLFSFGFYAAISSMLNRGVTNIDYFIIGRWLGTEALGYYTFAFQLSIAPQRKLIGSVRRVAFPAFATIENNPQRLREGFLQMIKHLFAVLAPMGLFMVALAPWFVDALYGEKWVAAIPILQILAIAGMLYGFDIAEAIFFAIGVPKYRAGIIGLRLGIFTILTALFGLQFGVVGVALSMMAAVMATSIIGFVIVARLIDVPFWQLIQPFGLATRYALFVAIPLIGLQFLPVELTSSWIMLIGGSVLMSIGYLLLIRRHYPDLIQTVRNQFLKRRHRSTL